MASEAVAMAMYLHMPTHFSKLSEKHDFFPPFHFTFIFRACFLKYCGLPQHVGFPFSLCNTPFPACERLPTMCLISMGVKNDMVVKAFLLCYSPLGSC